MATRTVSVAGGSYNTTGAWVEGVVPTSADDVVTLPAGASGTLTITAASACRSFDYSNGGVTAGSGDLSIGDASGGAVTLGGTMGGTWTTTLKATSTNGGAGWLITSNGKVFPGAVSITGAGGKFKLADAFSCGTNILTYIPTSSNANSELDTNNQSVTCGRFSSSSNATRKWTFGTSVFTVSDGVGWTTTTNSGVTLTGAFSIVLTGSLSANFGGNIALAYGSITWTPSGSATFTFTSAAANTFTSATFTPAANSTSTVSLVNTLTTTGATTFNSNAVGNPLLVQSSVIGTQRTISAASLITTNRIDFQDIIGSGAATWTTASGATYFGDCGNNSGITFTSPLSLFRVGAGGNWTGAQWSLTSGGTTDQRAPLPQDTVLVDANASGTLTVDVASGQRLGKDLDFTGFGGTFTTTSSSAQVFGSWVSGSGMTIAGTNPITFRGRSSHTITSSGKTFTGAVSIDCGAGTYTLQDALTDSRNAAGALSITSGTFVDGGNSVTLTGQGGSFTMSGGTLTKTGNWSITFNQGGTFFQVTGGTGTDTGNTTLSGSTSSTRTFAGGGKTYGTLTYTVAGSTGQLTISGVNTFVAINFSDATNARTLSMPTATATTISTVGGFNGVVGTAGKLMTVVGDVTSVFMQWSDYLSINNSDAVGPGWFAGTHSTNGGSNTGWRFEDRPNWYGEPALVGARNSMF